MGNLWTRRAVNSLGPRSHSQCSHPPARHAPRRVARSGRDRRGGRRSNHAIAFTGRLRGTSPAQHGRRDHDHCNAVRSHCGWGTATRRSSSRRCRHSGARVSARHAPMRASLPRGNSRKEACPTRCSWTRIGRLIRAPRRVVTWLHRVAANARLHRSAGRQARPRPTTAFLYAAVFAPVDPAPASATRSDRDS